MASEIPNESELFDIFQVVDTDHDGEIDASELQAVLSNGTWLPFNMETISLMMNMFNKTGRGKISFEEFGSLWKYVNDWQACFSRFDTDLSKSIDVNQLQAALTSFGYTLSPPVLGLMVARFDRHNKCALAFDDFIQCCIMLHTLTNIFKEYDHNQDGWITINYQQFMSLVMSISGS